MKISQEAIICGEIPATIDESIEYQIIATPIKGTTHKKFRLEGIYDFQPGDVIPEAIESRLERITLKPKRVFQIKEKVFSLLQVESSK